MPELDTVRGIAVLLVLFFHGIHPPPENFPGASGFLLSLTRFGWTGVNLFFVLSGFLITGILLDSQNRCDYFSRFYKRRAFRILPALFATLLALQLGSLVSWRFTVLSGFFLANCAPLFAVPLQYTPLWSLAVEEHFYLLWPAMVRRLSSRSLSVIPICIFLGTPFLRILNLPYHTQLASYYTWFNLDGLALGAVGDMAALQMVSAQSSACLFCAGSAAGSGGFVLILRYPLAFIALQGTKTM
jgi:peptidoglycan/LPS O-acetylase OafA/YrhL